MEEPAPRCLMTPDMHRERAAELRRAGTASALRAAAMHDVAARMLDRRFKGQAIAAPPLVPA